MKIVTSITTWNDAVGKRMSITFSELNEQGQIISDNNRVDRVITDSTIRNYADALNDYAQDYIDSL